MNVKEIVMEHRMELTVVPVAVKRSRGRKPGVKTVDASVELTRRTWLTDFLRTRGNNALLCHLLGVNDSFVSHLDAGRRTFTNLITQRIEAALGFPPGAIDSGRAPAFVQTRAETPVAISLLPELEHALLEMLQKALKAGRIDNAAAARLLCEIVQL